MKCKSCKNKLEHILTENHFELKNETKRIINVPAFYCPICNTTSIPDMIMQRCKCYTNQKKEPVIDFEKCDQEENDGALIATQILWM